MIAAGVIGGLYILCALILLLGVRERRGEAGMLRDCGIAAGPSFPGGFGPSFVGLPEERGRWS